jgi:energy-coupling factor transporter ATP-binding protein EcfA2
MTTASLMVEKPPLIKVVGVSASGKSTLVAALRNAGYNARPVSQEHSDVADLWKQFGFPRILIYLDNELDGQRSRRPDVDWGDATLIQERERLRNAREHADLRINTADLTADQVREMVVAYLAANRIRRSQSSLPPIPRTGGSQSG